MNIPKTFRAAILLVAAAQVSGCAVLRVDVDVYKGPLSNHEEVQTRQYIALALAARPILVQLRSEYEGTIAGKDNCLRQYRHYYSEPDQINKENSKDTQHGICTIKSNLARRLNVVLSYYIDKKNVETILQPGRLDLGLETLIQGYLDQVSKDPSGKSGDTLKALRPLEEMLLLFSERILYIANNQTLLEHQDEQPSYSPSDSTKYVLTLQSIGNSIVTHANELRFRSDHRNTGIAREASERQAAVANLQTSAAQAFESIVSEFRLRAERATAEAAKLSPITAQVVSGANAADITKLRQVVHAYRTVSGTSDPVPGMDLDAADQDEIKRNAQSVKAALDALKTTKIDGTRTSREIQNSLKSIRKTYGAARNLTANAARLDDATLFFDPGKDQFSPLAEQEPKKALDDVLRMLRQEYAVAASLLKKDNDNNELQKRRREIEAAQNRTKQSSADLQAARSVIENLRADILVDVALPANASSSMVVLLRKKIQEKKQNEKTANNKTDKDLTQYDKAIEVLGTLSASLNIAVRAFVPQTDKNKKPEAREVLDDVIASLRYIRIRETAAGHTEAVKNIDAAIKFAFDQRGGFAYLRPASAYLRDVYSGSSLQNDPKLEWSNMLSNHMIRGIPIYGPYKANEDSELRKVRAEIDKQHWQTVNSVRVAGAGNTNYVVAKDDIGNWYVKGYDADPAPIIRSAQNLALFNLGGKLGANLLARQDILTELQDKNLSQERRSDLRSDLVKLDKSDGQGNTAGLSGVLGRFQGAYRKRLEADFKKIQDEVVTGKLLTDLKNGWRSALATPELKTQVDKLEAIATSDAPGYSDAVARLAEPTAKPDTFERAETEIAAILDTLRALRRYHSAVLAHIDSNTGVSTDIAALTRDVSVKQATETNLKLRAEKALSEVSAIRDTITSITAKDEDKKSARDMLDKKITEESEARRQLEIATNDRVAAEAALKSANDTATAATQIRRSARNVATRTILGFVTTYTAARLESSKQFEDAATFITDAGR
jgi:nitrogen fixation protein